MISGRGRGKIRPPRRAIVGNGAVDDFETQWTILRLALREIHEKNASALSFEQLYRASYKIVLKKDGDKLYERVKQYEEQWFAGVVMPKIRGLITNNLVNITLSGVSGTTANERRLTGEIFLGGLRAAWTDHITVMNMTTDILMYMDRVYCSDTRKSSIFATAMGLFRDHILDAQLVTETEMLTYKVFNAVVLDQIDMERQGDVINKHLIRSCVYILEGLYENDTEKEQDKVYLKMFEPYFLDASRAFYKNECKDLLREGDASAWLRKTELRLKEEEERCLTTISLLTTSKIAKVVDDELIQTPLVEFLAMEGSGIKVMIENDRYKDLEILYQLVCRIDPTKDPLKKALQARVVELGTEINNTIFNTDFSAAAIPAAPTGEEVETAEGSEKPKVDKQSASAKVTLAAIKWVENVLQLKDKFDTIWKKCLNEDLILQTALTRSFSDFINLFSRCSEFVSLFIDENLKRGIKGKTEAEVDEVLEKATTLLRYIQDKDMFEKYYKRHLCRRLLLARSQSTDVEKQMISRMKMEIGNTFTSKLEGMFKDMTMSEELSAGYRSHIADLGDVGRRQIDLAVNVLTLNTWPMEAMHSNANKAADGSIHECTWPDQVQTLQESFKSFYLKERNGRKLTWLAYCGNAEIKCVFPKIPGKETGPLSKDRRYELNVTTYGMLILLLFNDLAEGESLTFEDIQQHTNIPTGELTKNLFTLSVHPKSRVLTKTPASKEVKPSDAFTFNNKFHSKAYKIKSLVASGGGSKAEGEEERKETEEENDSHRGYVIDTVLVRIMKARKTQTHTTLISETITQLSQRFKPDINMMKKQIESLIEREYLERVDGAPVATYRYLA